MSTLFVDKALLPDGWARNVRLVMGQNGRIADVSAGAERQAGDEYQSSRILLPAPANLHSHSFQRAMAGMTENHGPASIAGSDDFWTWRTLMYAFLDHLTPGDIEAIAALTFMEMLEAGFATVGEFHYVHHQPGGVAYDNIAETSERIAAAASQTGIGLTLLPVLYTYGAVNEQPLKGGQQRFGCDLERFSKLMDAERRIVAGLPEDTVLGMAPHSLRAVSPRLMREAAGLWSSGPVHIHAAEQVREVEDVVEWLGARPVEWLLDNADIDERWCFIHATHMTPDETRRMAESGAVAGLCPMTESNLGDGIFEGERFLAAKGLFGIGSDSNIRISLHEELRTLEYSQRLQDRRRVVLADSGKSAGRTLYETALSGGARAMGRDSGALAPGLYADLVAIDASHLSLAGLKDDQVLDGWIFAGDQNIVRDVWSAGRHMVRAGRHIRRDAIEARYRTVMAGLLQRL